MPNPLTVIDRYMVHLLRAQAHSSIAAHPSLFDLCDQDRGLLICRSLVQLRLHGHEVAAHERDEQDEVHWQLDRQSDGWVDDIGSGRVSALLLDVGSYDHRTMKPQATVL